MSTHEPHSQEGTGLDERDSRALEQYLTVLPNTGRAKGAADLYLVVSQSGREYLVDSRAERCTCPDHEYRSARCKHLRRVAFATGERPIPDGVEDVDPQLGEHVDDGPQVVATDGGIVVGGDDAESLDEGDGRPVDCSCTGSRLEAEGGLPCWPCYRDGFDVPNPRAGEE